jgi:hypothetical protein
VGVDSIKRKISGRRQLNYFRSRRLKLPAELNVLRLRGCELRRV